MADWTGNKHSIVGCLGASNHCQDEREKDDYYATHPSAGEWLLKIEDIDNNIWECACGEGHLSKVFMEHGHNVKSTDLVDRGFGIGNVDFLKQTDIFDGDIVTNPPYKYAQEFIEKALELVPNGHKVCMFLKVQFMEGKARKILYENNPPKTIWVSSSRLRCGKGGNFTDGNMIAYAWYVWEKGYKGTTQLKWFN